jgi:hypothetical protein
VLSERDLDRAGRRLMEESGDRFCEVNRLVPALNSFVMVSTILVVNLPLIPGHD